MLKLNDNGIGKSLYYISYVQKAGVKTEHAKQRGRSREKEQCRTFRDKKHKINPRNKTQMKKALMGLQQIKHHRSFVNLNTHYKHYPKSNIEKDQLKNYKEHKNQ